MSPTNRRIRNFSSSSSSGQNRGRGRPHTSRRIREDGISGSKRSYKSKDDEGDFRRTSLQSNKKTRPSRDKANSRKSNKSLATSENSFRRSERKNNSIRYSQKTDKPRRSLNARISPREIRRNDLNREEEVLVQNSGEIRNNENHLDDIFWGRHATQAILESGRPVHRIWCTAELRSSPKFLQLLKDSKSLGVLVEEVSWARLGYITHGGVHQGIALQTAASKTLDLQTLIDGCSQLGESSVLIALDGLTDPHNVGAIIRSAEALGAHGLVLPQRRSAGLTGSVAKVAAGALEHFPVARVVNLNRSLIELKDAGYSVIGLAGDGDFVLNEVDLLGPLVLVIGSEDKGLSVLTRRNCDQLVRVPLRGVTSSLNASVAASISLYEIASKGWMKGLSGQAPSPKQVRPKLSNKPVML
ncbi:23S rRNA (guanosine(2251)-2'-O)-methyltransferase RlmB [Prochlorococcus marinus]|uniref:RNA methyltransferase TrmH, group 3 n=1 Tax=Prochlorococcus marinus (strain MIT 9211) TaxID=93059 RepID=A9B9W5_PROM4|nr:23S rRNA (guanosine(2251)-2'-O)-methyltransferase RlmB [Prochlorococcus marinus]ABX08627.1 RNA methyltransferase TrmH, group 3 [Prochlorococcus marinus str. MIT 9211]